MFDIDASTFHERLSFVKDGAMRKIGGMYQKVCMERNESGIFVRSFNQVSHTLARVSYEGGDPFRLLFNPSPLLGAVKRVEGQLKFEVGPTGLEVSGPVSVQHSCVNGEDFIDFPSQEVDPVQLKGEAGFAAAITQVESAVDENAPNQKFAGIYLGDRHSPGTVCCVGCNTTSLVEVEMADTEGSENFEGESILPARSLKQIKKLLAADEEVNLYLGEREASFVSEIGAVCTRLVADKYPNYRAIIPDEDECQRIEMPSDKFKTALQVCQEYTEDFSTVFLDFEGETLTVRAAGGEGGSASYEVPIDTTEMGRMRLKCSADRMMEVVKPMKGRTMSLFVPIEAEPTRVRVTGETEGIAGAVALMRLQPKDELEGRTQDRELQAAFA
jgi:DNA polymerase III sliding clamp (beta) subunit (PCNA family)